MSLAQHLDARRRAMLDEMGIKVWLPMPPTADAAPVADDVAADAPGRQATLTRTATPPMSPSPVRTPRASAPAPLPVATPTRTPIAMAGGLRLAAPQALYAHDERAGTGGWLVVADMPPGADGRHGPRLGGDAGRLLDQMLRALRLHAGTAPVHLLRAHRSTAGAPVADGDADFDAAFDAWAAPLAPRIVLAMGPLSAQRLLGRADPLGRLRGQPHPLPALGATTQLVATYHPAYLLRNGADKARAWADLCLAAALFESA